MKTAGRKKYIIVALGALAVVVAVAVIAPSVYSSWYSAWQKRQLVERLKKGVDEWNRWRKNEGSEVSIDLSGADLSGVDLGFDPLHILGEALNLYPNTIPDPTTHYGVNLFRSNLAGSNLSGSDLMLANLIEADLRRANLRGSNLMFAFLVGADLTGADLSGADLSSAIIFIADLGLSRKAPLKTATFKGANIYGIKNPPEGFIKFALKQGAIQELPRSEKEDP